MIACYAKDSCGCCSTKMLFDDTDSAWRAFCRAGLHSSTSIVDDTGNVFSDIDTYFDFSLDENEILARGFDYVASPQNRQQMQ